MADLLEVRSLHRTPAVEVIDVSCRIDRGSGGEEEHTGGWDVVFPRAGIFRKHSACGTTLADANQVLFFRPDEAYRVSHPIDGGDACTVLSFRRKTVMEASTPDDPFPVASCLSDRTTHLRLRRLRRRLLAGRCSSVETEERAFDLLGDLIARVHRDARTAPAAERSAGSRRRHDRAEAAREILARRFRERLTLADVAREISCSPFHLARIFHVEIGLPVHRYLSRLRLRAGLERIEEGERDLTSLALDLGFSSHAHFTDAFRSEFGRPPSRLRPASGG
jgi:AraC-like DNA-binding protein